MALLCTHCFKAIPISACLLLAALEILLRLVVLFCFFASPSSPPTSVSLSTKDSVYSGAGSAA